MNPRGRIRTNAYAGLDPRFYATVLRNGDTWNGRTLEIYAGGADDPARQNASPTGYYLRKFLNENLNLTNDDKRLRSWIVFRYAEILLNFAEAMNEAYGPDDAHGYGMSARDAVDAVRARSGVGMPPVDVDPGDAAAMRTAIKHERRIELAFEDHRYWDLRRWDDAGRCSTGPARREGDPQRRRLCLHAVRSGQTHLRGPENEPLSDPAGRNRKIGRGTRPESGLVDRKISNYENDRYILFCAAPRMRAASCQKADSERPWGSAVIYMPQAGYTPYAVPNGGTAQQSNKNYRIDTQAGKVHIFLGIYRAGLAELQAYTVSVSVGSTPLDGTVLLPGRAYTLPSSVSCPDGKRDATFFLTVDIAYLKAKCRQGFSLPVTISDPTR